MKKLLVIATLLAAFASFGCGSSEPAAEAPAKAPQAAAKTETRVVEKEQKKQSAADKEMQKIEDKYGGRPMVGQTKPGDTIHHFSK